MGSQSRWAVAAHFVPVSPASSRAHHVPVLLHVKRFGPRCMAMRCTQWPTSASGSGSVLRLQPLVDRLPGLAAIVGAERARRRNRDRTCASGSSDRERWCAGPCRPRPASTLAASGRASPAVPASSAAIGALEEGRILHARIDRLRIVSEGSRCQTRLNSHGCGVPSYHWCCPAALVGELVAYRLPRLAAVVGALNDLPEPATDCEA